MNKKAQSLSLNTIIIAILVVLVLIVVVTFFLGGFSRVTQTITSVFFPVTTGTDLTVAIQTCEQRCEQAKLLPSTLREKSAFCTSTFSIDQNGNGVADRVGKDDNNKDQPFVKFYCKKKTANTGETKDLGISCEVDNGQGNLIPLVC